MAQRHLGQRRVTIKDIARAADVHPSTVTRALQEGSSVKPETRERIAALAREMGYRPNMAARTLVMRRSHIVGVAIPDMTNPFFADLAHGIEDEAAKHGLRVVIRNTSGVESAERDALGFFLELKVDGVIVPMARCPNDFYESLAATVPIVHVNRAEAPHHVSCDSVSGSRAIMEHLIALGHRRIAFIAGPTGPGPEPKILAYRERLEAHGIPYEPDYILTFSGALADCGELADILLERDPRPTAVFAWNDLCAIGLIHALRARGIDVPADMSVAGHDDLEIAACMEPPLTTVHWPMYEMGQHSIRYLYKLREGRHAARPSVPAPELRVRGSTGRAPG